ncbi:unnamed protein product [Spirodela intermedia]|uniref:Peptidase A1 domain-containing protein n=1 Tax=Spirodela intermedia TaxID=51605 RepID=A0A7I8JKX4_SPIIN|nr:unnamed protein product [Spirodela intermedia]CAA6670788.1 unnamed protein product [Spirodela intermedia]
MYPHLDFFVFLTGAQHRQELNSSGLHLTLHDIRSPCSPAALPEIAAGEILRRDQRRVADLAARLAGGEAAIITPKALNVPLSAGVSVGVGNYVAKISLGTPARDYIVVFDTGSSLNWLQCKPCSISCHKQVGPIFDPQLQACNELQSATLNPPSCSRSKICIYQASYGDGSFSVGYLSKDTLSLGGGGGAVPGFIYGCGQDNEGLFGNTAGLIGLARNRLSMLYQLGAKYGYAFSYCLPTKSATGFLSIGSYNPAQFSFTPLVANRLDGSLYFLSLAGVSVGRGQLAVAASEYKSLPTIIDSGTVITRLPTAVYEALSKAVVAALARYPRAPAFRTLPVPEVTIAFAGGAQLKLAAGNVMYDVSSTTTCLAFAPASNVAIIGNRQHQTFKVVYDVTRSRIGFAAGGCS